VAAMAGSRHDARALSALTGSWALAWRNLLQDRIRFAMSVLGIALAVMLILFLFGLNAGIYRGVAAYLNNAPGSVIVMPQGVKSSFAGSGQLLPPETAGTVTGKLGDRAGVTPVLTLNAVPELHGRKENIRLVGYDPALGGGPWKLSDGREPAADNEIVLDRVLADRHNFKVGDSLDVQGLQLTVVGLSMETSSFTGSIAFARKALVESLVLAPGGASFLLITPGPGSNAGDIINELRTVPGTNVLLKQEVISNDKKTLARSINQVIYLMVTAAFIVGALVVGMVIYTATIERRSEYGVIKAIGARSGVLYRVVAAQALVAAGLGVLVGVGLAFLMGQVVATLRPQFLVDIERSAIAYTVAAGFIMALLGGLAPARALAGLAPADVFRR